ncbi:uncharacterized protein LOC105214158 [Zeugodacus cucurbitae]|uniref:Putative ribosome biogenesis GTPase RsgA n=1 Tax=Zeugodacus cucurbitae TaxID=28588 RepID=A0A0A1XQD3_ZEUCU|nr:uncharacterized protein LOC105214158 [Zeugodacus cucurbitae]
MSNFVLQSCLALLACCCLVTANYVPGVSYIDDVELSYKNDVWRCDRIVCPVGTYGCKIVKENVEGRDDIIRRSNSCYDVNGHSVAQFLQTETLVYPKTVEIYVNSYVGASSSWSTGYNTEFQSVNATIDADSWPKLQQKTRENIKRYEENVMGKEN